MKLTYKINLIALAVLALVGVAITIAGVSTIRQATYSLNSQLMQGEVESIRSTFERSHEILVENQLENVSSYVLLAQSDLLAELSGYGHGATGKLIIVTNQGTIVLGDAQSEGQQIDMGSIPRLIQERKGVVKTNYLGKEHVLCFSYFPQWNWMIFLSITSEEIYSAQKQFVTKVIVIILICLVLGALIFAFFIKKVVKPILQLSQAATHVSEGQWETSLPMPAGKDEISQLTASFRHMAANLAEMYGEMESNLEKMEKSETALRESEEKTKRTQEFLQATLNNIGDPIFVKDAQHRWIMLNDAFCSFMGHKRETMLGKSGYDFLPEEEANVFWQADDLIFTTEEVNESEELMTDAHGVQHIILTKKAVFQSVEGSKLLVGTIKDITERKRMEEELLKNQKLKSISILAGGIAHDFNNILTAILGNLSLLKEMVDKNSIVHNRLVKTEKASNKAKDLTQQLLTFSHGGAPVKNTVSLEKLIGDSVTFTLSGTKVRQHLLLDEGTWAVDIDESQMSRAMHNIAVNAIQAMPRGGLLKVTSTNLQIGELSNLPMKAGRYVCITFEDNGTGIAQKTLSNIFDPYFTTKDDGSGLGLAITYSVIQRHEGHITVESKENVGTSFFIYLPASDNDPPIYQENPIQVESGSGNILIMDDEQLIQETVSAMLVHLGYRVECVADGEEALNRYSDSMKIGKPFDAVIMDLTIPGGMGGQEAIKALLNLAPEAKALVSSGYSQDPVMANFRQYGFEGVITKPFELHKIATALQKVLNE